jgi:UDP-4-amino-4,6-dideoxy-N-acetyl-beta-L-altrosamine N-acetyltransferase
MKDIYSIREMNKKDLGTVFKWRNHPDIRSKMFSQNKIGIKEHDTWFKNSSLDSNITLLIFEVNSQPMGFINFKSKNKNEIDWGFYMAPESPKGIGTIMAKLAINFAFNKLKVIKIHAQVISSNIVSIKYHKKIGFKEKNTSKKSFYNHGRYEDIIFFELTQNNWKNAVINYE